MEVDKALRNHSEEIKDHEKGSNQEDSSVTVSRDYFTTHLKEFNNDLNDNKKFYMVLKEENDDFLEKYKKSVRKQKDEGSRASFHTTFLDLLHLYKNNKGYAIKDLSVKNDLFDQSPLLLGNNKIIPYLKMIGDVSIYLNDMKYLEGLNELVVEKLNNESNTY